MNRFVAFILGITVLGVVSAALYVWGEQEADTTDIPKGSQITDTTDNNDDMTDSQQSDTQQDGADAPAPRATLKTSKGDITIEFYQQLAPNTVANFLALADKDFYDGVVFHRVIEGFMIQGGDPTGSGRGGPGYTFDDEFDRDSDIARRGYVRGTVAMANAGPNTNGSQFFIVHEDTPLPYDYTIFGRVVDGLGVVDAIAAVATNSEDRPLEDITINDVIVE